MNRFVFLSSRRCALPPGAVRWVARRVRQPYAMYILRRKLPKATRWSPAPAMPPAHEPGLHGLSRPGRALARRHRICVPGFAICWHPELRNHVRLRNLYWQAQNRTALPTTGPKKHGCSSMSTDSKRFRSAIPCFRIFSATDMEIHRLLIHGNPFWNPA